MHIELKVKKYKNVVTVFVNLENFSTIALLNSAGNKKNAVRGDVGAAVEGAKVQDNSLLHLYIGLILQCTIWLKC